jgi:hypothetical protein
MLQFLAGKSQNFEGNAIDMLGDKKKYKLLKCYVYLQGSSQKI